MTYPPKTTGKWQVLGWMPVADFEALKANIAATGRVQQPMTLDEANNVLDGHHRQHAVEVLRDEGIKVGTPDAVVIGGLTNEQKFDYVLSVNLVRRHLTQRQRRSIIADALRRTPERANNWLAELCGCDKKTVQAVRRRLESMREIPTFTTFRRRNGKTYPHTRVFAKTVEERERAAETLRHLGTSAPKTTVGIDRLCELGRKKNIRDAVAAYVPSLPDDIQITHSDFRKLRVKRKSVRLILTDPLWSRRQRTLWSDLADFADRVLCDGGVLAAFSGVACLPDAIKRLSRKLNYVWCCSIGYGGGAVFIPDIRGRSAWRPMLMFVKGRYRRENGFHDYMVTSTCEKNWHEYQRGYREVERYLRSLSEAGDLVCDPFGGSFTTAVAAAKNGRRFIGCDIDAECVKVGQYRVADELGLLQAEKLPPVTVRAVARRLPKRAATAG